LRPALGLCGTDQSENEGCLGILHIRLYVKQVKEKDVWLRPMGQREGVPRRTAARRSRNHRRWKTAAAAEAEAAVAAAATDAEKVGGAPLWEVAGPVPFGAPREGRRADGLGPQQGALAHVSSALDCTMLSSLAA